MKNPPKVSCWLGSYKLKPPALAFLRCFFLLAFRPPATAVKHRATMPSSRVSVIFVGVQDDSHAALLFWFTEAFCITVLALEG